MIPNTDNFSDFIGVDFSEKIAPSKTYKLDTENTRVQGGYIENGLEAVKQALYLRLETEKYKYSIYSELYGSEIKNLIGLPEPIVEAETIRYITETCMSDDRVTEVSEFRFKRSKEIRICEFKTSTIFGDLNLAMEVIR